MERKFDISAVIRQAFRDASGEEVEALARVAEVHSYPEGHLLITEGQVEHVFYILAQGQVAITHRFAPAGERLMALRHPGEFFGEMALIERMPRSASARAVTGVTVIEIGESIFNEFLRASPSIALGLIRRITANLRAADQAAIAELSQQHQELERAYQELKGAQAGLAAKERLERELEIAADVQRSLLPAGFPPARGYSFAGRNVPARQVGGDLYDVLAIDSGHVGLLLADVSDKGMHAALIMAVTRTLFLAHAPRSLSPVEVARAVHDGIMESSSMDDMFVTVFYGVLNLATGRLRYVRAGQEVPLLYRAEGGPPIRLGVQGRFLGMFPDLELEEGSIDLRPQDMLVVFSDGVPDALNEKRERYRVERLMGLLDGRRLERADRACSAIFEDVFTFRGEAEAFDDITVLVAQRDAVASASG